MKARRVEGLEPEGPLRDNAALIVGTRLVELRGFEAQALEPAAEAAQHEMRIAAKRLRYVLEIFGGCFPAQAPAAQKAAKRLQGALGDLHDCDVMLARAASIESLTALLRERRELIFSRFCNLCEAESARGTWAALEEAL
jgi:CHAD domain-containing protein